MRKSFDGLIGVVQSVLREDPISETLFVFFNSFAVNMVLQYRRRGRWADYAFGEFVYVVLSLTAKSALAWQVFAGALAA